MIKIIGYAAGGVILGIGASYVIWGRREAQSLPPGTTAPAGKLSQAKLGTPKFKLGLLPDVSDAPPKIGLGVKYNVPTSEPAQSIETVQLTEPPASYARPNPYAIADLVLPAGIGANASLASIARGLGKSPDGLLRSLEQARPSMYDQVAQKGIGRLPSRTSTGPLNQDAVNAYLQVLGTTREAWSWLVPSARRNAVQRSLAALEAAWPSSRLVYQGARRCPSGSTATTTPPTNADMIRDALDVAAETPPLMEFDPGISAGEPHNPLACVVPVRWVPLPFWSPSTPSPLDVVQGAIGSCFFSASTAAVAWARPDFILARNARGHSALPGSFPESMQFEVYRADGTPVRVDVSAKTPVEATTYRPIGQHDESMQVAWPSMIEKAVAAMNGGGDRPVVWNRDNLTGAPAGVFRNGGLAPLTGLPVIQFNHRVVSFLTLLYRHAPSGRLRIPMVTGTRATLGADEQSASDTRDFDTVCTQFGITGMVAGHEHTALGWFARNDVTYVVVRNPWGADQSRGTPVVTEGAWEGLTLGVAGVFALRADAFAALFTRTQYVDTSGIPVQP